jgi:septum formation protein
MGEHHLLLASQSPRRRELLALLGLPFETITPDVAEEPRPDEPPAALAARLSQVKARSRRAASADHAIVVGCDTIVALESQPLGKPRDDDEATEMLRLLRGQTHAVYSGITLVETGSGRTATDVAETQVTMRAYTDAELAAYVASGDPLDKAGAYGIQHVGFRPVAGLQGCYLNVMGLPLCHLARRLRAWGIEALRNVPVDCQAHTGRYCPVYEDILSNE